MNKGFVSGMLVAMALSGDVYAQENRCVEQVFTPVDPCQIPGCSDEMQECQKQAKPPKEEPRTLCAVYNGLICNIS